MHPISAYITQLPEPSYCERISSGIVNPLMQEPINASSNILFLFAAMAMYKYLKKHNHRDREVKTLTDLLTELHLHKPNPI